MDFVITSNYSGMSKIKASPYHFTDSEIKKEEQEILNAIENPKAFEVIYDRYFLSIYKYILVRVSNELLADEITSMVMLKAMENLHKYQFKGLPFSAWLYRVAYNELQNNFRQKKAKKTIAVPVDELHFLAAEALEDSEETQLWVKKLKQVLPQLKSDQIELIQLRFFESRSFKEIGEIVGITEANAKVKTHRVIKKIAKLLGV